MQLSSPFNIQLNYVPDNILMHAIEKLHNMCYQCSVHCKFHHVPCDCHDCHAWTVQLNNCAAVNEAGYSTIILLDAVTFISLLLHIGAIQVQLL